MATHDLHFTVSNNGVEDNSALHDDPTLPVPSSNAGGGILSSLNQSSHPTVCIFHVLFKGLAMFFYIFGGLISKDKSGGISGAKFIVVTVCCILLLALDFWTVKNVTGRLLVGLRWWNQVEGDTTKWIFESAENKPINKFDSSFFWTVLYLTPAIWVALLLVGILKLNLPWIIIVLVALAMSSANVYGYYKCSSDQKAKFQQMVQAGAERGAVSMMRSGLLGFLAGSGGQSQSQQSQQTYV